MPPPRRPARLGVGGPDLARPPPAAIVSAATGHASGAVTGSPPPAAEPGFGARRTLNESAFLAVSDRWLHRADPLAVDGEIRGLTPVRITLAPNALRVTVTPGFRDS